MSGHVFWSFLLLTSADMGKSQRYSDKWQGIWHRDADARIEQLKKCGARARLLLEKSDELWVLRACIHNRKDTVVVGKRIFLYNRDLTKFSKFWTKFRIS